MGERSPGSFNDKQHIEAVKEPTMRLPEARIKEAILHPDKLARQEALVYFSKSFSLDPEVMPLAIQAIEKFGRREAFSHIHVVAGLVQTENTLDWAIRELNQQKDNAYCLRLSRLVVNADPTLLPPREREILKAPGFSQKFAPELRDRLQVFAWDADQCWKELEEIAEAGKGKTHPGEVNFGHATQVVKALARQGDKHTDRLLELLRQKVDYEHDDPMAWLEIFLVMLAGEMRLVAAIPQIVAKLHDFGELLAEKCVDALAKIGTDQTPIALSEGFLQEGWDYRLYASGAFDAIHADATVTKCLELLPKEKEADIRTNLAYGVLGNFALDIEPVRQLILNRNYDPQMVDLPRQLVAATTVMGVTFPEYDQWKKEAEEKQAHQEQRMQELEGLMRQRKPARPPAMPVRRPQPVLHAKKRVGRNDPCPCGSGKKFKTCCMNRSKGLLI
jgi:hypothetical protein